MNAAYCQSPNERTSTSRISAPSIRPEGIPSIRLLPLSRPAWLAECTFVPQPHPVRGSRPQKCVGISHRVQRGSPAKSGRRNPEIIRLEVEAVAQILALLENVLEEGAVGVI